MKIEMELTNAQAVEVVTQVFTSISDEALQALFFVLVRQNFHTRDHLATVNTLAKVVARECNLPISAVRKAIEG